VQEQAAVRGVKLLVGEAERELDAVVEGEPGAVVGKAFEVVGQGPAAAAAPDPAGHHA
jgi:hypothetical protein